MCQCFFDYWYACKHELNKLDKKALQEVSLVEGEHAAAPHPLAEAAYLR
jgi:hypothetical protein